jgi:hypothetical protein
VPDEVAAFRRRVEAERDPHEVDDLVEGAWARRAQEGFQLGKRELDGIEVRAIRREEAEARPDPFDRGLDLGLFVDDEIVEDHHVARPKRRHEHLLDVGEEGGIVEGPVEHGRGLKPVDAQRRNDRVRLPVSTGRVVPEPGAPRTAAIPAQQIGCDARLVDEHIAARVMQRLRVPPAVPRGRDVRAPLFVGVYRFF